MFQGKFVGALLLLSGSCIGLGMLAMPIPLAFAGFFPSLLFMCLAGFFMASTACVLLELQAHFPKKMHFMSLCRESLGSCAEYVAGLSFFLLFFPLMIAYFSKGGDLIAQLSGLSAGWAVCILAVFSFFSIVFGISHAQRWNRYLMGALLISYLFLLVLMMPHGNIDYVFATDWSKGMASIPFMITAFGFHNLLPSIYHYGEGDATLLKKSVWGATLLSFVVYAQWVFFALKLFPLEGETGFAQAYENGFVLTQMLKGFSLSLFFSAQIFSFFALITSILGQSLSLVDFLMDALSIPSVFYKRCLLTAGICALAACFSLLFPHLFFGILEFVGGGIAILLFGIFPCLMLGAMRKKRKDKFYSLFPKSRFLLFLLLLCSISVISFEILTLIL